MPQVKIPAFWTVHGHDYLPKRRFADETSYLRSGSLNFFDGIVPLNFSCNGSHYIPYEQFLGPDPAFREGNG